MINPWVMTVAIADYLSFFLPWDMHGRDGRIMEPKDRRRVALRGYADYTGMCDSEGYPITVLEVDIRHKRRVAELVRLAEEADTAIFRAEVELFSMFGNDHDTQ